MMVLLRKRWLCRVDGFVWFVAALVGFGGRPFLVPGLVVTLMWKDRWQFRLTNLRGTTGNLELLRRI